MDSQTNLYIDLHIKVPIYHPANKYGWPVDEQGIGIAFKKIKSRDKDYLIVKVGKEDKYLYKIYKDKVIKFCANFPRSFDECKGVRIAVIPIQKWGKKLKIWEKIKIKRSLF